MAKDEEKFNPVASHAKSLKSAAIKKNKAAVAAQRNERLAHRNPDRLQRQIDDLKSMQEAQGGELRPKDKQMLEQWERELKTIKKAREGKDEPAARGKRGDDRRQDDRGSLGKRGRDDESAEQRGASRDWRTHNRDQHNREQSPPTDEDVRRIPMPRDTPPPLPRRQFNNNQQDGGPPVRTLAPAQIKYSSAPQVRNLQKEATAKFVPAAVAAKLKALKGDVAPGGRYLEPEEVDALEQAGYAKAQATAADPEPTESTTKATPVDDLEEQEREFQRELAAETMKDAEMVVEEAEKEAEFRMMAQESDMQQSVTAERQRRHVEMEEVEDEDEDD